MIKTCLIMAGSGSDHLWREFLTNLIMMVHRHGDGYLPVVVSTMWLQKVVFSKPREKADQQLIGSIIKWNVWKKMKEIFVTFGAKDIPSTHKLLIWYGNNKNVSYKITKTINIRPCTSNLAIAWLACNLILYTKTFQALTHR